MAWLRTNQFSELQRAWCDGDAVAGRLSQPACSRAATWPLLRVRAVQVTRAPGFFLHACFLSKRHSGLCGWRRFYGSPQPLDGVVDSESCRNRAMVDVLATHVSVSPNFFPTLWGVSRTKEIRCPTLVLVVVPAPLRGYEFSIPGTLGNYTLSPWGSREVMELGGAARRNAATVAVLGQCSRSRDTLPHAI
jgi:hypothetical protein